MANGQQPADRALGSPSRRAATVLPSGLDTFNTVDPPRPLPPAGWYDDPSGLVGTLRWWDGRRWGAELRPHTGPYRPVPPPGPNGRDPGWQQTTSWQQDQNWQQDRNWQQADGWQQVPGWPPNAAEHHWAPSWQQINDHGQPTSRTIPARAVWWGLLGFVVGELLGGILATGAALAAGTPLSHTTDSPLVTLAGEIGLWGGLLGACILVSRRYGTRSLRRDYRLLVRPVDLGIGALVALAALVVDSVVGGVFLHSRFQGTNTQLLTGQRHNGAGFVVVTLIAAVGAPFFEELFFRGLLRTALRARLGPVGAIGVQAVLFGLAHFDGSTGWGNVSVVVAITGVGLILGYTAERSGRLGPGMIGHGLFNLVVAILTLTT